MTTPMSDQYPARASDYDGRGAAEYHRQAALTAILDAWMKPGKLVNFHARMKDAVRRSMPELGRALDEAAGQQQRVNDERAEKWRAHMAARAERIAKEQGR